MFRDKKNWRYVAETGEREVGGRGFEAEMPGDNMRMTTAGRENSLMSPGSLQTRSSFHLLTDLEEGARKCPTHYSAQ